MNTSNYLRSTAIIDWTHPAVTDKARELSEGLKTPAAIALQCFEFVRDDILHSHDHKMNPVTLIASDVLLHRTGYCYAKSHLLAALLRANGIPTGLCYQRLTLEDGSPPYCLHGLNAVYLPETGWYRMDARGNRSDVDAQFTPPVERLAFPGMKPGETMITGIWSDPLPIVVEVLSTYRTYDEVRKNLPDVELG